jgi:hypothetical protein
VIFFYSCRYMGHPLLCDRLYGGGVAFSDAELVALETSNPPVEVPIPVRHAGDVKERLEDLLDATELETLSPSLAAARTLGSGGDTPQLSLLRA